jgi:hypothetical protein
VVQEHISLPPLIEQLSFELPNLFLQLFDLAHLVGLLALVATHALGRLWCSCFLSLSWLQRQQQRC